MPWHAAALCVQGYIEAMQWRYISHHYAADDQAVTLFFGLVGMAIGLCGNVATTILIELSVIGD